MRKSPVVLAIAVVLFAGWLTWLGYQAVRDRRPIVVSRAQLAVSQYDVVAKLTANPDGSLPMGVRIVAVRWAADNNAPAAGDEITVLNIDDTQGYQGTRLKEGSYLIPLVKKGKDYEVAGLPLDPGYPPLHQPPKPRVYPLAEVESQLEQIFKDKDALRGLNPK